MKICTSITGCGNQTIRDLIQFATFATNLRHVLCDLCESATDSLNDCIQWDRPGNKDKTRCQDRRQVLCTQYLS